MIRLLFVFFFVIHISLGKDVSLPSPLPACPIQYVTDGFMDSRGTLWICGEGEGIYKLPPGDNVTRWVEVNNGYEGFPRDRLFTCLAEDWQGRIWAGTKNEGLTVFNGTSWKIFDRTNALLGDHIFDIAVSPVSGEVAVATSGGISIYRPDSDTWLDRSLTDGLSDNQVRSLAYDREGSLWIAYCCGGAAHAKAPEYNKWESVAAPWYWGKEGFIRQPLTARGSGLPSNLCNALLVTQKGNIHAGTCAGIATRDKGGKWSFIRGNDYLDKNKGLYNPKSTIKWSTKAEKNLLPEDYITKLAEAAGESLWVGMRQKGVCRWSPSKGVEESLPLERKHHDRRITCLVPLPDGSVVYGSFGGGLGMSARGSVKIKREEKEGPTPAHPSNATPPSEEGILEMLSLAAREKGKNDVVFAEDDWSTRGDWCGRYGWVYTVLCAANAPADDCRYTSQYSMSDKPVMMNAMIGFLPLVYSISGFMGVHRQKNDAMRSWVHWVKANENRNVLFCPTDFVRTEAEWDDHGEAYAQSQDGPDLWSQFVIPEGMNAVSFYFYNPNGEESTASRRDYLLEMRKGEIGIPGEKLNYIYGDLPKVDIEREIAKLYTFPVLCRTRVDQFSACGVYKTFHVKGPGTYWLRICRNNSFNTLLNGVFISKLLPPDKIDPEGIKEATSSTFGKIMPVAPALPPDQLTEKEQVFLAAWSQAVERGSLQPRSVNRIQRALLYQYRILLADEAGSSSPLLARLKWDLSFRTTKDDKAFDQIMEQSWEYEMESLPSSRSAEMYPHAKGVTPFTVKECMIMDDHGIDWKPYRNDSPIRPDISVEEMKKKLQTLK